MVLSENNLQPGVCKRCRSRKNITNLQVLKVAFKHYYDFYSQNREQELRRNWIRENLAILDADYKLFDPANGLAWIDGFKNYTAKRTWYKQRFQLIRENLEDRTILRVVTMFFNSRLSWEIPSLGQQRWRRKIVHLNS